MRKIVDDNWVSIKEILPSSREVVKCRLEHCQDSSLVRTRKVYYEGSGGDGFIFNEDDWKIAYWTLW
jgi:hypothetical protein